MQFKRNGRVGGRKRKRERERGWGGGILAYALIGHLSVDKVGMQYGTK